MASKILVLERLPKRAGETRYCNCESDACANVNNHQSAICMCRATVLAECFGLKQQLCNTCLTFAQQRYNSAEAR